jgi:hypothetical protein
LTEYSFIQVYAATVTVTSALDPLFLRPFLTSASEVRPLFCPSG